MASIQYLVKGTNNPSKIGLRMYISRENQPYVSLNILINPKLWSGKKQRLKGNDDYTIWVNNKLSELNAYIEQNYSIDYSPGEITDKQWLKEKVNLFFNRPKKQNKTIVELLDSFIEENPTIRGKNLKKNTLKSYKGLRKNLKEFKDVPPISVNLNYHKSFLKFLQKKEYGQNMISKQFAILKSFMKKINDYYGVTIHKSVKTKDFFIPSEIEVENVYLNEERIKIVRDIELEGETINQVRDNAILGLRTGLRVSDFLNLHSYNIKEDYIEVQTKKTNKKVIIPIHEDVQKIFNKYKGLPPNISDQKFNQYIKGICHLAGFTENVLGSKSIKRNGVMRKVEGIYPFCELVASHTCRRSFATNLYGKLPNFTIMQITGHTTEKSFKKYIKITSKEHAEKLRNLWKEQKKED